MSNATFFVVRVCCAFRGTQWVYVGTFPGVVLFEMHAILFVSCSPSASSEEWMPEWMLFSIVPPGAFTGSHS